MDTPKNLDVIRKIYKVFSKKINFLFEIYLEIRKKTIIKQNLLSNRRTKKNYNRIKVMVGVKILFLAAQCYCQSPEEPS